MKALEIVDDWLVKRPKDKAALKLRDQLQREVVLIEWFSEPEGALVALDGEELGPTPITITVDPGSHRFRFTRDGYQPLEREEKAVSGTRPKFTAVLDAAPEARRAPAQPGAQQPEGERRAEGETALTPVDRGETPAEPARAALEPVPAGAHDPPAAERKHSSAPLIIGTAGLFIAIGGGVLTLTSFLTLSQQPFDVAAQNRQYAGYALVGAGAALGIAAIVWLLIERRPGATDR